MEDKIVYLYNWKDLVMVTRTKSGIWETTFTISKVIKRLNNKRAPPNKIRISYNQEFIDALTDFAVVRHELTNACMVSYGDNPELIKI